MWHELRVAVSADVSLLLVDASADVSLLLVDASADVALLATIVPDSSLMPALACREFSPRA